MSDFELVIRGNIVDDGEVVHDGWIGVLDGKVVARGVSGANAPPRGSENVDARGMWLMAGVVDGQVHSSGHDGREGLGSASRAAAAGGVTVMVDSPYDDGRPVSSRSRLDSKIAEVKRDSFVDVALVGTLSPTGLDAVGGLVDGGVCGFQFSTFDAPSGQFERMDEDSIFRAFQLIAPTGLACAVLNQMHELCEAKVSDLIEENDTDWDALLRAHPPLVEDLATALIYELGASTGARAHAGHVSTSRGLQLCDIYRRTGHAASLEIQIHHLMLNQEDHARYLGGKGAYYPPIRPRAETDRLWSHVANNQCGFVSSGHLSVGLEQKSNPNVFLNDFGGPGLETLLPAFWTGCEIRGIAPSMVARQLCSNPARHFWLHDRKGSLDVGKDADIVLLERDHYTYDPSTSLSSTGWSPFEGMELSVRVAATYCRGVMVHERGGVDPTNRGFGRFLRPRTVREAIA